MSNSSEIHSHRSHWPLTLLGGMSSLLNLFLPVVLVRVFGPSDVGVFKIFFLYLALVPELFLSGGLLSGIALWSGRGEAGKRAISIAAFMLPVLGIVAMCSLFVAQSWISSSFQIAPEYILIFAICAFASISSLFFEEALICSGRVWMGASFHAGSQVLRAMLLLGVALLWRDLSAVFLTFAIFTLLKFGVSYVVGYRLGLIGLRFRRTDLSVVMKYSFPVSFSGVLALISERADQFLLAGYLSAQQFAVYSLGCLVIPPLYILEQSVTRLLVPDLSRFDEEKRFQQFSKRYQRAVAELSIVLVPSAIGLILFAEQIVVLLFTERYIESAIFLQLFAVTYLFLAFPFDVFARARGDGRWILRTYFCSGIVALLLTWWGLELAGAVGALSAIIAVQLLLRVLGVRYASQSTGLPISAFLPVRHLTRITAIALVTAVVISLLSSVLGEGVLYLFVGGGLFWIGYGIALLFLKSKLREHPRSVCFVLQQIGVGGIERMALQHAQELIRRGVKVSLFVYDHYGLAERENLITEAEEAGLEVIVSQKSKGFSLSVVWRLVGLLIRSDTNVLHSHDLGSLVYASLSKIVSPHRVRLVHTQHSFVHLERNRFYPLYERLFTLFADELVVVSEEMKERYGDLGVSKDRISVVRNGVVAQEPFPGCSPSQKKAMVLESSRLQLSAEAAQMNWIVYLARLFPRKGQRHMIGIWNELPEEIRLRTHLFFVGPFADNSEKIIIEDLIQQANVSEHIHLVPGTKSPEFWLSAADLFVSASEFEGNPLTPAEALILGTEVALSDIPGHSIFKEHATVFPLHDAERAARILVDKLESGTYLSEPSVSRREYLSSFSISAMSDQYMALYWPLGRGVLRWFRGGAWCAG